MPRSLLGFSLFLFTSAWVGILFACGADESSSKHTHASPPAIARPTSVEQRYCVYLEQGDEICCDAMTGYHNPMLTDCVNSRNNRRVKTLYNAVNIEVVEVTTLSIDVA